MQELRKFVSLVQRNIKTFFKDKMIFFVSMITPLVMLVLFSTFLRSVYVNSIKDICAAFNMVADNKLLEGFAGAWLISSILSVSSVTVAFCSNTVIVNDKTEGNLNDLLISPVRKTTVSLSYYASNFAVTFIVMFGVLVVGFIYLGIFGWHIPVGDLFMILIDMVCAILFGTLLSGIIVNCFISKQGVASAVSGLVSSMYGFICGAYMPISQFGKGLRDLLACLPGTHSVCVMRLHFMSGYINILAEKGLPAEGVKALKDGFDANLYIGGKYIPVGVMYGVLLGACAVLLAAYVLILYLKGKRMH